MINFDVLKQSLVGMGKKNKFIKDEYLFKPSIKDGEIQVRILPYKYAPDNPFIQLNFHYNIGCTMRAIENDPITKFAEKLKKLYNQDEALWRQGKAIEPKLRIYAPILIRGREHEGVKFWGFSKTIYEKIVKFILDPEYGDITDLNTGTDIKISIKQVAGKSYNDTDVYACRNSSPATSDPHVKQLIDNMVNIDDVLIIPTYDDLVNQFKLYTSGESSTNVLETPIQNVVQQSPVQSTQPQQQTITETIVQSPIQSTQPQQQTITEKVKNTVNEIDDSFWDTLK